MRRHLPSVERGGIHILAPRGEVLSTSPVLRWKPATGATQYDVWIGPVNGSAVFETTVSEAKLALPVTLRTDTPYDLMVTDPQSTSPVEVRPGVIGFHHKLVHANRSWHRTADS